MAAQRSATEGYSEEDVVAAVAAVGIDEAVAKKCLADYCTGTLSEEEKLALQNPAERQAQKRKKVLKGIGNGLWYVPKKVWSAAAAVKSWVRNNGEIVAGLAVGGGFITLMGSLIYFEGKKQEQEALEQFEYFCGNPTEAREADLDGEPDFSEATRQYKEAVDNSRFSYNNSMALVSYLSSLAGQDADKTVVCGTAARYLTTLDAASARYYSLSIEDGIALFGYLASISGSEGDLGEVSTAAERYATFLGSQQIDVDDGIEYLQAVSEEGRTPELDGLVDQAILRIMNDE